jgi:MoaA/NifB/PqqE/SkfB family radical SAM enzyme
MHNFTEFYKDYIEQSTRINVDCSYICPLQCPFCSRQTENAQKIISESDNISLNNFNKIIKKYNTISLVGTFSDSIYNPNFIEMIQLASKHPEISFSISTNGTRKKLEWWKTVFSHSKFNIKWVFGLDGTDQETANIYRVNTRYDEVMEVMKLGVSMGVKVEWQFIMFKHNEHQIEEAKRIAKENKINLLLVASSWWFPKLMKKNKIYPPSDDSLYSKTAQSKFIRIHPE